jgi:hypothetical protein
MSLHKFAEQVASQGRGDDSLLVHMTPDEVRNLQQFAQANGTTLTINPTTGLPEAGLLSDLFKAVAPIALGAFLGPAGLGMSSMMAGVATGGITTLATGSLSRGLMAGLGAYGGAGLAQGFMDAGTTALGGAGAETALQAPSVDSFVGNAEGMTSGDAFNNFLKSDANPAVAGKADVFGAGAKAAMADPMGFAKQNLGNLAYAAAPIAAGLMVPTTTKLPDPKDTGRIRQMAFNINPDTGRPDPLYGMREMPVVKASDFGDKTFKGQRDLFYQQNPNPYELGVGSLNRAPQQPTPMAGGGIVALAKGGDYTTLTKDSSAEDIASAYKQFTTASGGDTAANQKAAVDYLTNLGIGQDKIGQAYGTYQASPTYNAYTDEQIGSYFQTNPNANIAADIVKFNADPNQVNRYISNIAAPFVGSTDTTGGSGTLGIYNQMNALGIDPNELYASRIAADPKYAGWSQADITRGYNLDKGALALAAADKDGVSDKEWAAFMDANGYSVNDMAQAFGLSKNEVQRRYDAAKKVDKIVTTGTGVTGTGTGGTGTGITTVTPQPFTSVIPGGFYGNATNPGDITTNKDGTVTVHPNIPYRPYGGFSGIEEVSNAYTKGGGSLGYKAAVPKTAAEHNALYNKQTDDSLDAYNFLMGKGKNLTQRTATADRPVMRRYDEAVLGRKIPRLGSKTTNKTTTVTGVPGNPQSYFDEKAYLAANPDVAEELRTGKSVTGEPTHFKSGYEHYLMYGKAGGRAFTGDYEGYTTAAALANAAGAGGGGDGNTTSATTAASTVSDSNTANSITGLAAPANQSITVSDMGPASTASPPGDTGESVSGDYNSGGLLPRGYAMGGGLGSLGSYSDGGRLLKGPGDGVSDSIPATIGRKQQPARLADGEFVIPARIVSELGNGSTDAGAKKLYAMMDRVQRARGKTTGKNKIAANSRSDKYLPA